MTKEPSSSPAMEKKFGVKTMIDKKNDSDMESCLQSAVASASQYWKVLSLKATVVFIMFLVQVCCMSVLCGEKISKKSQIFAW